MPENRLRQYLDPERAIYRQQLEGAQDSDNRPSSIGRMALVAGLGTLLTGAAFTRRGQQVLGRIGSHLQPQDRVTGFERALTQRYYDMNLFRRNAIASRRYDAAMRGLSRIQDPTAFSAVRDSLIEIHGEKGAERYFTNLHRQTGVDALTQELLKRNRNLQTPNIEQQIRTSLTFGRYQKIGIERAVQRDVNALMKHYDDALYKRFATSNEIGGMRNLKVADVLSGNSGFNMAGTRTPFGLTRGKTVFTEEIQLKMMRDLVKNDPRFANVAMEKGLMVNRVGQVVDLRGPKQFISGVLDEAEKFGFMGLNPMDLLTFSERRAQRRMPLMAQSKAGDIQTLFGGAQKVTADNLGDINNWRTAEQLYFIGGKVVDAHGAELAKDLQLESKFSRYAKGIAGMMGLSSRTESSMPWLGRVGEALGLGLQERASRFEWLQNYFTKHSDPNWIGNVLNNVVAATTPADLQYEVAQFGELIQKNLQSLDTAHFEQLFGADLRQMGISYDLSDPEGIAAALRSMATDTFASGNAVNLSPTVQSRIDRATRRMMEDGNRFFGDVEAVDQARNVAQQGLIDQVMQYKSSQEQSEIIGSLLGAGGGPRNNGFGLDLAILHGGPDEFKRSLLSDDLIGQQAKTYLRNKQGSMKYTSMRHSSERILAGEMNGEYLFAKQAPRIGIRDVIRAINNEDHARAEISEKFGLMAGQFFAGRNSLERFTTLSSFMYHVPMGRIQDAFAEFGIGLGPEHTGNMYSLYGNMILRRYLPAVALASGAAYLSYEMGKLTGYEGDEMVANLYQNTREQMASVRDKFGITSFAKRLKTLTPGSEFLLELPVINFFDPTMSRQDVEADATDLDPIRKGRWWSMGNTPFVGGKISYFAPSWQVRAGADPKMTDVLYGSEDEYWRNHWLPTPRYPLAPIRHFITDRYHWEEKHYRDRPYPVTGPVQELAEIPIMGSLLSKTAGEFIKPSRRMHEDEMAYHRNLARQGLYEANVSEHSTAQEDGDPQIKVGAAGQIEFIRDAGPLPIAQAQEVATIGGLNELARGGFGVAAPGGRSNQTAISGSGSAGFGRAGVRAMNAQESDLLHTRITEPARTYAQGQYPVNPDEYMKPNDLRYELAKSYYGMTEMAGIYGFMAQSVTGQPMEKMKVVQDSHRMTSANRAFWDLEVGGIGGNPNEIGRRFIPKDRRYEADMEYNPLRNQMPNWMPGDNYFINFKTGDPFIKVPRGEARLPGGGYEALFSYHPEQMDFDLAQVGKSESELYEALFNRSPQSPADMILRRKQQSKSLSQYKRNWKRSGQLVDQDIQFYDETTGTSGYSDAVLKSNFGKKLANLHQVDATLWTKLQQQGGAFDADIDQAMVQMHALDVKSTDIIYTATNPDGTTQEETYKVRFSEDRYQRLAEKLNGVRATATKNIETGKESRFDRYDPLHRFLILADVAPYSDEYKYYKDYVEAQYGDLTGITGSRRQAEEEIKGLITATKKRVGEAKKKHRFTPYRFVDTDVKKERVHVTEILESGMFLTKEYGDNPIKMAGVSVPNAINDPRAKRARNYLEGHIKEGDSLKIAIDRNESEQITSDTLQTIRAVVYDKGKNLNLDMIRQGIAKEKESDWSPAGVHSRFSTPEIGFATLWERFAHMDTPFHTKFLPVRSALEEYKRKDIYGKSFQQWSFEDQVKTTVESVASKPISEAVMFGAGLGFAIYGKTLKDRFKGAKYGAAVLGGLSLIRSFHDAFSDERWIPKRRRKEREVNEYFDILDYVKYKGLYEFAAKKAKEEENFDVKQFVAETEAKGEAIKKERRKLEGEKRELKLEEKKLREEAIEKHYDQERKIKKHHLKKLKHLTHDRKKEYEDAEDRWNWVRKAIGANKSSDAPWLYRKLASWYIDHRIDKADEKIRKHSRKHKDKVAAKLAKALGETEVRDYFTKDPRITEINQQLEDSGEQVETYQLGDWSTQALEYKKRYESTLYGAPEGAGVSQVMGALPAKEREYFAEFLTAKPEERKEILSLVPKNQRRFLQSAWGEKDREAQPDLQEYFKTHYLPDANWEGWSDTKDLENVKLKVVKNEGLDLSEFGFWRQDEEAANRNQAPTPNIRAANVKSPEEMRKHLMGVMRGVGLSEIDVTVEPTSMPGTTLDIQIEKDRRQDIADYVNNNLDSLL